MHIFSSFFYTLLFHKQQLFPIFYALYIQNKVLNVKTRSVILLIESEYQNMHLFQIYLFVGINVKLNIILGELFWSLFCFNIQGDSKSLLQNSRTCREQNSEQKKSSHILWFEAPFKRHNAWQLCDVISDSIKKYF